MKLKSDLSRYSPGMRMVEVLSLVLFAILFFALNRNFFSSPEAGAGKVLICLGVAYVLSDFVSGLVHWFADTWGSYQWPVIGNSLIRSFREHHVDPLAMTHHDFIEVTGTTALVALPILVLCLVLGFEGRAFYFSGTATWLCLFTLLTGQFHKWAHQERSLSFVSWLQRSGLILSTVDHSRHHQGAIDSDYCMTTGWLNPLLNRLGFFRHLETLIQNWTGAIPRLDDRAVLAEARKHG